MGKKRKVSDNEISGTINDGEAVDFDYVYNKTTNPRLSGKPTGCILLMICLLQQGS